MRHVDWLAYQLTHIFELSMFYHPFIPDRLLKVKRGMKFFRSYGSSRVVEVKPASH